MQQFIDLTPKKRTFLVPTSTIRDGVAYMGPDIKVQANSTEQAREIVKEHGYIPNRYFPPRKVTNEVT